MQGKRGSHVLGLDVHIAIVISSRYHYLFVGRVCLRTAHEAANDALYAHYALVNSLDTPVAAGPQVDCFRHVVRLTHSKAVMARTMSQYRRRVH
jgi:hypothetical protein